MRRPLPRLVFTSLGFILIASLILIVAIGLSRAQGSDPAPSSHGILDAKKLASPNLAPPRDGDGTQPLQPNKVQDSSQPSEMGAVTSVPSGTIGYQGTLARDGHPVNGSLIMTFTFYNAASGGSAWWQEAQTVQVDSGLFNVMLGATNPLGDRAVWFSDQTWLGVQPAGAAELVPRQPLGAVGYAMNLLPGATMWDRNAGGSYIYSFYVQSISHPAVLGESGTGNGVTGISHYTETAGLKGSASGAQGAGVAGLSTGADGRGVHGQATSSDGYGGYFENTANGGTAVFAEVPGTGATGWGVRAESHADDGVFGWSHGIGNTRNGVVGRSNDGYGIYGFSSKAGQYEAAFPGAISVGSCDGCTVRYRGLNTSESTLSRGDLVRVTGVTTDLGIENPILEVAMATPGEKVLGVVAGRVEMTIMPPGYKDVQPGPHFGPVGGPAAPGDYVVFVVQGLAQARVDQAAPIRSGDDVYLGRAGVTTAKSGSAIGLAVDEIDEDGLVWVLVGFD